MREHDVSTVERSYQHGLELARAGEFFAAHEAFEAAWRACTEPERDFAVKNRQVLFDSRQAKLGMRPAVRPKIDFCQLFPHQGRTQLALVWRGDWPAVSPEQEQKEKQRGTGTLDQAS